MGTGGLPNRKAIWFITVGGGPRGDGGVWERGTRIGAGPKGGGGGGGGGGGFHARDCRKADSLRSKLVDRGFSGARRAKGDGSEPSLGILGLRDA